MKLAELIARLCSHYGEPSAPPARGPFQLVLWENACYLLPDERRAEVFEGLRMHIGLTAKAILSADPKELLAFAQRGGMQPGTRVLRWLEIARITQTQFEGDLDRILEWPHAAAKKALKQFPGIGDPGAEKILLLCGKAQGLPLESNGLRVLTRIGYGRTQKNYGAMYKSVQDAVASELPGAPAELLKAHLLLREHGKALCKATGPICRLCPVSSMCAYHGSTGV